MASILLEPLFNRQLNYVISKRKCHSNILFDVLFCGTFLLDMCRFFIMGVTISLGNSYYLTLDHVIGSIVEYSSYDVALFYLAPLVMLQFVLTHINLFFICDHQLWSKWLFDLVNTNWEHFIEKYDQIPDIEKTNRQLNKMNRIYLSFIKKIEILKLFRSGQRINFDKPLKYFQNLMPIVRTRILFSLIFIDFISKIVIFCSGKFILINFLPINLLLNLLIKQQQYFYLQCSGMSFWI